MTAASGDSSSPPITRLAQRNGRAFLALGSVVLGWYYTPGETLSPWFFVAAAAAGVAIVAGGRQVHQDREDRRPTRKRRRRG